ACVSARELMIGKLIGISALGLSVVVIWIGAMIGVAYAEPSSPLGFLVPALASLGETPWVAAAMIFYFLAGYLTIGMLFLAAGVLSDSMQEAQAYLTPLAFVIAAPSVGLSVLLYRDPNGLLPRIGSWIPLYTPVTMLARLQSGVSHLDIFGTAAMLLAFGGLELFLLGRLFENNLIKTGQGFHLSDNVRRTVRRGMVLVVILAVLAVGAVTRHRAPTPPNAADGAAAMRTRGEGIFKTACASCHDPAAARAPSREQLAAFTAERVVAALTSGAMKPMAAGLGEADIRAVAAYLTGGEPVAASGAQADPPPCPAAAFSMAGAGWNGWSTDPRNWRFQPDPGLAAADIPRLKVKWALGYLGGKYRQPSLVGSPLFLTSLGGAVYSLAAQTA